MEHTNPYAELGALPAAQAAASERAAFLKRVYGILFLGVLGFAATLWAAGNVEAVRNLAVPLGELIYGNRWGMFIYIGIFMAGSWIVHSLAEKKPINVVAYASWVFLLGLLIAPIVLYINGTVGGAALISQASLITALTFAGLSAFVLVTGKDFKWLRGILFTVMWGVFIVAIVGMFMGFSGGLWLSGAIVICMAGYILYDTSEILHRYPTTMAMSGAIVLFTDVVLLFKHVLLLLMRSRD